MPDLRRSLDPAAAVTEDSGQGRRWMEPVLDAAWAGRRSGEGHVLAAAWLGRDDARVDLDPGFEASLRDDGAEIRRVLGGDAGDMVSCATGARPGRCRRGTRPRMAPEPVG